MAKCNYHLSPRPLAWAIEPLLEICKPVGMWANLAREENAFLRKYLVKSRGSTQPKFGIAGFSHTAVFQWPSPGNNSRFFQPLSVLGAHSKIIYGKLSCYGQN